jgi:hypothetical protein
LISTPLSIAATCARTIKTAAHGNHEKKLGQKKYIYIYIECQREVNKKCHYHSRLPDQCRSIELAASCCWSFTWDRWSFIFREHPRFSYFTVT